MINCRYRDEEIKKKIDDKLTKQNQTEWKLVSRDSRENNTKKNPSLKQGQNVNNVYLKTSGEYVNNHYSNVLGAKNVYKGSNFINNEETEGSSKITNNKKFNNNKENNFSNINNFSNKKYNTINANTFNSYNNSNLKTPSKILINSNNSSIPIENNEIDVDHYFNAALNVSKENESISKEKVCKSEKNGAINQKINPITQEEIKEFVQEIHKNRDIVSHEESLSCSTPILTLNNLISKTTQSNTSQSSVLSSGSIHDVSNTELSLNITSEEQKQENILNENKKDLSNFKPISESKIEEELDCEFKLEYDLSKIPSNFLNANSYSNYFYQTGSYNQKNEKDEFKLSSYKMDENHIKVDNNINFIL
jgi:hypothetical protein